MKIKINILILLLLLLFSFGCIEEDIDKSIKSDPEESYLTIIVGENEDYLSIQNAIDNASKGDVILIKQGVYQESIIINKKMSLIGSGRNNTTIYYTGNQSNEMIVVKANNCTIKGFTIRSDIYAGFITGLKIVSSNNKIINNTITNVSHGISLTGNSENNNISNNIIKNNLKGIEMQHSSYNIIFNNNFSKNRLYGILLEDYANNNIINHNRFVNNNKAIRLRDVMYNRIKQNSFLNNEIDTIECCGSKHNQISQNTYN